MNNHNLSYVILVKLHTKPFCGTMCSWLVWTSLTHCIGYLCPTCVIVGRQIGSGAARQLPREPWNIPSKIPEMAIKRNFTLLYFFILLVLWFYSLLSLVKDCKMKKHIFCNKHIICIINSHSASWDNWCTVGGDGGCRVGEVRAGTTSPMPDHKGFKLQ